MIHRWLLESFDVWSTVDYRRWLNTGWSSTLFSRFCVVRTKLHTTLLETGWNKYLVFGKSTLLTHKRQFTVVSNDQHIVMRGHRETLRSKIIHILSNISYVTRGNQNTTHMSTPLPSSSLYNLFSLHEYHLNITDSTLSRNQFIRQSHVYLPQCCIGNAKKKT